MIGDAAALVVGTDDDTLHAATSPHPWWTETYWLSFGIAERRMQVCVYPWFRPNIGMQAGGVIVWDGSGVLPWDLAFCDYGFHLVMPDDLDLRGARLPNGLELRCLEPQQAYSIKYTHEELTIDVIFQGIMDPMVAGSDGRPNHIDQPGIVTGTIVLRGEEIPVDAAAMRDRGWSVRLDTPRVGYAWGTVRAPQTSFLAISLPSGGDEPIVDGYFLADGQPARLLQGVRATHRDAGRPETVRIDATDALGRRLEAEGTCVSQMGFSAYPGTLSWDSVVQWELNGSEGWGEDQDVWPFRGWREATAGTQAWSAR